MQGTLNEQEPQKSPQVELLNTIIALQETVNNFRYSVRLLVDVNSRLTKIEEGISACGDRLAIIEMCLKAKGFLEEEVR
jgi:hypothetical protein